MIILLALWMSAVDAFSQDHGISVFDSLKHEISKSYSGAQIKIVGPIKWVQGEEPEKPSALSLLGDDGRGNMHFVVKDLSSSVESEGWVGFSAWIPTRVPLRRIHSGEALREDMFVTQLVEVSNGMAHEYRGLLLPAKTEVAGLEAIQTLLEGQFLTSVAVQKIPDVRRGDSIQIRLLTSGLVLITSGIAEEPGYIKGRIRVMTGKSKRELSGFLQSGGIVEVPL